MDGKDPVNPGHYKGDTVMVVIEQFGLGFCLGNLVKYVLRAKEKNGVEDLKKANWYLQREIATQDPEAKTMAQLQQEVDNLKQQLAAITCANPPQHNWESIPGSDQAHKCAVCGIVSGK